MKFIDTECEFVKELNNLNKYIDFNKSFPDNVFKLEELTYSFITFDEVRMRLFFNHLCTFCNTIGENSFLYMVTDPGPEDYFYKSKIENPRIERYKALICSVEDSDAVFIRALNSYSGGSAPDNMMDCSDVVVVSSIAQKWHIVADRETGVGVCVFYDSETHKKFTDCYGEDLLDNVQAAAEFGYGETKWGRKADHDKIDEFLKNYSTINID